MACRLQLKPWYVHRKEAVCTESIYLPWPPMPVQRAYNEGRDETSGENASPCTAQRPVGACTRTRVMMPSLFMDACLVVRESVSSRPTKPRFREQTLRVGGEISKSSLQSFGVEKLGNGKAPPTYGVPPRTCGSQSERALIWHRSRCGQFSCGGLIPWLPGHAASSPPYGARICKSGMHVNQPTG